MKTWNSPKEIGKINENYNRKERKLIKSIIEWILLWPRTQPFEQ